MNFTGAMICAPAARAWAPRAAGIGSCYMPIAHPAPIDTHSSGFVATLAKREMQAQMALNLELDAQRWAAELSKVH